MNKSSRVSVIMPVYNAAETLSRAIESFLQQSFEDWELIAVNDGSNDNSLNIIKDYSNKDSRIVVVDKPNGGVASARQAGMDASSGEYFIHADSDDWVEPDMLSDMLLKAEDENLDILIADYFVDRQNGKTEVVRQRPKSFEPRDVLYSIYAKGLFGGLCHKLIKKSAYDKVQAHFIPGLDYCEDKLLLTRILRNDDLRIGYIDRPYYHYIMTESSLTRRITKRGFDNLREFNRVYPKYLPADTRYEDIKEKDRLNEFVVGFVNEIYSKEEIRQEFDKVKDLAYKTRSPRWLAGYICIQFGLFAIAHKLIKY